MSHNKDCENRLNTNFGHFYLYDKDMINLEQYKKIINVIDEFEEIEYDINILVRYIYNIIFFDVSYDSNVMEKIKKYLILFK